MATTNLSLNTPSNGSFVNSWDAPLNNNFTAIDTAFGGESTINVVGASGTVALTLTQYGCRILLFSGTLTANVNYQIPSGVKGFWFLINNTTGAFTVSLSSAGGGSAFVAPQGYTTLVLNDGVNAFAAQNYFSGNGSALTGSASGLSIGGNAATATNATNAANATFATQVTGTTLAIGYLQIPQNVQAGAYAPVAADVGKHIYTASGVTINSGVFNAGDSFLIVNSSASAITVTQGTGVILRFAGTATTGARTIAGYGFANVLCLGGNVFSVGGAGVS